MFWKKIQIINEQGELIEANAPVIISASRSTDIPAFFASSFMDNLRKGYTTWINPFNHRTYYISFAKTRLIVFWSKNPESLIPYLEKIDEMGINYYFQFTLNDYEKERFEPNLPSLKNRIETFIKLSEKLGTEKVVWRFDPLILTSEITVSALLKRICIIGDKLINHTNKLVFSFVDIMKYWKVKNNLLRNSSYFNMNNLEDSEFKHSQKLEFAKGLQNILNDWKQNNNKFKISTCAEDINLEKYNIQHNKCIDDELIKILFRKDKELMDFLGYNSIGSYNLKDKGQRKDCCCIISKDIGAYNTCEYNCTYCYANEY